MSPTTPALITHEVPETLCGVRPVIVLRQIADGRDLLPRLGRQLSGSRQGGQPLFTLGHKLRSFRRDRRVEGIDFAERLFADTDLGCAGATAGGQADR